MQTRQMILRNLGIAAALIILLISSAWAVNYGELESIRNPLNPPGADSDYILDIDNLSSDIITTGTVSGTTVTGQIVVFTDDCNYITYTDGQIKLYVNCALEESWGTTTAPTANSLLMVNGTDSVLLVNGTDVILLQ